MPAVAAVAIPAVAGIAGGIIASRAAGKAAKAQQQSTQAALDYERETQRSRQARYDAAMADYQKRYDAWLEQYYGVKPPANGAGGGVHASSGPSAGGGDAITPPYQAVSPHRQGDNIAALLMQIGQLQGNAAQNNGQIWGNTLTNVGQGVGAAFGPNGPLAPKPKATVNGQFQTIGLSPAEAGISPWQPTGMPAQPEGGPFDWRNYLGSGVM